MSWTEVFPALDDEVIDYYEKHLESGGQQSKRWFEIDQIFNAQPESNHILSTSLFWERDESSGIQEGSADIDSLMHAEELGISKRFPPWETYFLPIFQFAQEIRTNHPGIVFRVYLSNELSFLVEALCRVGCEVYLMQSSSTDHNPGAMWRFLALEESGKLVTIINSDRANEAGTDILRTIAARDAGIGGWRTPYYFEQQQKEGYRPINASQFGSCLDYPMKLLMEAFIWANENELIRTTCILRGLREAELAGTDWPNYGFDEWFLLAVMYPRMAAGGLLTFYPWDWNHIGQFLTLDIEYCTWSNPQSELVNYPNFLETDQELYPWSSWVNDEIIKVRQNTKVFLRKRDPMGPCCSLLTGDVSTLVPSAEKFVGNLQSLMRHAVTGSDRMEWLVDINPRLGASKDGAELFLDRAYDQIDLAYCGSFFARVDENLVTWAAEYGLEPAVFQHGAIIKIPKLEGPVNFLRLDFAKKFLAEYDQQSQHVAPEIFLLAWVKMGKAKVKEITAKSMGWSVRQ